MENADTGTNNDGDLGSGSKIKIKISELERELRDEKDRITVLESKTEVEKFVARQEAEKYRRDCSSLGDRVARLEEDCNILRERVMRDQEKIRGLLEEMETKEMEFKERFIELKVENRDLECGKRRAQDEVDEWRKKFFKLVAEKSRHAEVDDEMPKRSDEGFVLTPERKKGSVACLGGDEMLSNAGMVMSSDDGMQGAPQESLTGLYNQLCYEAIKYAQEGAVSEEIYNVAMSALKEAAEKVAAAKRSAATVGQVINGGQGSSIAKCSNEATKPASGNELVFMQQPLKFVLIPSTSLENDSNPANHSVESPMMIHISNGLGINIHNSFSVLKQAPTAQSAVVSAENGFTDHMDAGQNSQKLKSPGESQESQAKTTPANGNTKLVAGFSDTQMVAFPGLPVTLYMPVMGSLSESSSGTAASNEYTLVAAPAEASPVITGTHPQANNNSSVQQSATPANDRSTYTFIGPNPQVHATAIAAGARVIPPQEAASVIKAIEARVRSSKSAPVPWCWNSVGGPSAYDPASTHADAMERREQCSSEGVRLRESGEGFKEMDVTMMDQSAVYDSACGDHLFSDGGS